MCTIKNLARGRRPSLQYKKLKNHILGKDYALSVVFSDSAHMKKLNREYRKESKPASVLSFPLTSDEGEIFLNLDRVKKDSVLSNQSQTQISSYLLIHGMLHLNGFQHSSKMDSEEQRVLQRFGLERPG